MKQAIQLTPRLRAAADWVEPGTRLCDVGTDHAHLPAALMLEGVITQAIASDIRKGPLERAGETVKKYGLEKAVSLRLCPGLEGIQKGEADTVTICGMGGEMILGILRDATWTRENVRLILQPQRSQDELRLWLRDNGYIICKERVVQEGQRWYTLILAEGGADTLEYTPAAELVGHPSKWEKEESRLPYLRSIAEKLEKLQEGMERSSKPEDFPRKERLALAQRELKEWIQTLEKGAWVESRQYGIFTA